MFPLFPPLLKSHIDVVLDFYTDIGVRALEAMWAMNKLNLELYRQLPQWPSSMLRMELPSHPYL